MDFDAKWFPGFDDYYITRFGPDAENLGTNVYWGILVNDTFTDVGGCQAQVHDGNRVLWAYDAFHERGFLKLAVTGDTGANPQPTTTVVAGQPVNVTVSRAYGEKNPNYVPVGGMTVAPVTTAANGVQTVVTGAPEAAVSSGIDGNAALVFSTPGWHRIKADGGVGGPIRSNRLDVCVVATAGGTCGAPPADTTPQQAPPLPPDPIGPPSIGPGGGANNGTNNGGRPIGSAQGAPVIELPRFTTAGAKAGRIALSWKVLRPGVGVKSWSLASRAAGATSGAWAVRAHGTKGTSARLALAGRTVVDDPRDVHRQAQPPGQRAGRRRARPARRRREGRAPHRPLASQGGSQGLARRDPRGPRRRATVNKARRGQGGGLGPRRAQQRRHRDHRGRQARHLSRVGERHDRDARDRHGGACTRGNGDRPDRPGEGGGRRCWHAPVAPPPSPRAIVVASALTAGPPRPPATPTGSPAPPSTSREGQLRSGDLYPPAALLIDGASTQAWGALGLAAGGVNAAKQRRAPAGTTAL